MATTGSSKTHYFEAAIENWLRGTPMPTAPATLYVALFTASPGEAGTLTNEVSTSGTAYVREAITNGTPASQTTGSLMSNTAAVVWPAATSSWGTITHMGWCDAATAGNVLEYQALTTPQAVSTGNIFQFPVGSVTDLED